MAMTWETTGGTTSMASMILTMPRCPKLTPKAKTYMVRQAEWVKENKIGRGVVVRVLRKAGEYEGGWNCGWVSAMDGSIGNLLRIDTNEGLDGIRLSNGFLYPFFVLEVDREGKWGFFKQKYPELADTVLSVPQRNVLLNLLSFKDDDFSLCEIRQLIEVISMGGNDAC